ADHPAVAPLPAYDTAGSVRDLISGELEADAAIGSALAARLYGDEILLEGIDDHPENFTRFLVVAPEPGTLGGASKTSLVFHLANVPGSLYRAMGAFANRGLDL